MVDLQTACSRYVERNVIYCVSTLIYDLREVADQLDDYDTYVKLTDGMPDYEEAARYFIDSNADLDDLEQIADSQGYWSDVLESAGAPDDDVEEWLEAHPEKEKELRSLVWNAVNNASAFQEVCDEFNLDPEYSEIYEHWIVDRYFGRELEAQGQIVEDYLGLLIWGRGTTGQAISMDSVIETIVRNLARNHWVWQS